MQEKRKFHLHNRVKEEKYFMVEEQCKGILVRKKAFTKEEENTHKA
jgi:hypothetical protein